MARSFPTRHGCCLSICRRKHRPVQFWSPGCCRIQGVSCGQDSSRARIVAKTLKDAVVVPQRAVAEVQGNYQLGIIGADGKAEIRPVNVGPRVGSDWVITSGLKPGEKVVVEGLQKIKTGMPVVAKPWTRPSENTAPANSVAKEEKKSQPK